MTRHDLPWLITGVLLGWLVGIWLARHDAPPPCADEKEPPLDLVENERKLG